MNSLWFIIFCILYQTINCERPLNRWKRVIGGEDANMDQANFVVQLIDMSNITICTGFIIGPKMVLTAAHCV